MVSVGILAALLNVLVLITVAIADRALEFIIRNFAISRLQRTKRAPVVHDSDTWLLNIPRSVLKYRRHPAILFTIFCAIFLIVSEVITELGVEQSSTCSPTERHGLVITAGDSNGTHTTGELLGIAFHLRATAFVEGPLTHIPAGMPKNITGRECFSCLNKNNHPDIIRSCTATQKRTYEPGQLQVAVRTTKNAFGTICDGFRETGGQKRMFTGFGDLTGNGRQRATFLFTENPDTDGGDILYFEYADQKHIDILLKEAQQGNGAVIWEDVLSRVYTYSIKCDVNELSPENFRLANMVYRTMLLENPVALATFYDAKQMFEPITQEDVYRSVLSMKIIEDTKETGMTYEYTECGKYNWRFLAPILVVLLVIITLGLLSMVLAAGVEQVSVPHNSRTWFHQAARSNGDAKREQETRTPGYFETMHEEMVLVPDVNGSKDMWVVCHSRSTTRRRGGESESRSGGFSRDNLSKEEIFELQEENL